jgi:hypothetical protein
MFSVLSGINALFGSTEELYELLGDAMNPNY